MKIIGYADRFSAFPGDALDVLVSCDAESYRADVVQLIHGDTNPDGPGFKIREIETDLPDSYEGRVQRIYTGSFAVVERADDLRSEDGITFVAMVCPTRLASGVQAIMSKWHQPTESGFGLYINEERCIELRLGDGDGGVSRHSTDKPLLEGIWYLVAGAYRNGKVEVTQLPYVTRTNGRFAIASSFDSTTARAEDTTSVVPRLHNEAPLQFAAHVGKDTDELIGQIPGALFNGKIDSPRAYAAWVPFDDLHTAIADPASLPRLVGAWDFENEITKRGLDEPRRISDTSGNELHGRTVNMPTRGVTGYNWLADEQNFIHAPEQYGAIHFHEDDLDDARWMVDFTLPIPDDLPSALYAVRLRAENDTDYVPFYVRPKKGEEKKILFLAPTASYMAYANDHVALDVPLAQLMTARVPVLQEANITLSREREFGLSTYDHHSDGSGVAHSSRLRPILNMRPGFRHWLSPSLWQFNADLHLIDWMIELGYDFDVMTDFDLHREGPSTLEAYNVVITGTHPEYYSAKMLDGLHEYTEQGGRLMYMGANGFYWVTNYDGDEGDVIEVRKGHGNNAWKAAAGEYHLSFSGEYGSLWRHRGRAPQRLFGVGFGSEGFDVSEPYYRTPDGYSSEASWMFEGIVDEVLGDFGLVGDGAAGLELDICDASLGTPPETLVVAASAAHTDAYAEVTEELFFNTAGTTGTHNPRVRGDIVYFPTANGGGVWSVSSIAYCGSLSHNQYDNNISRLTKNVLDRFAADGPAPYGAGS
ncbi:N,N-dimethylformamidase beta subunit family domain-containing protein [uncultured Dietzia sp.]|uniref:N,N-dimethylformamidase beta subunit family domain-containing protein n=1 Tax=uncultured Dietzia sp. TaxID=395519 RepID=UPI0025CF3AF3|nr:N,N-dimethylformamidase beta subunit family domain-containing protein [uncultured Dietzia sp.]